MKKLTTEEFAEGMKAIFESLAPKTEEEELKLYEDTFKDDCYEILKDIYTGYFKAVEGPACSVDKARFVARRLLHAVKEKKHLTVQETYIECRDRGGNLGGLSNESDEELDHRTYWSPITLKTTKDAIDVYYIVTNLRLTQLQKKMEEYQSILEQEIKNSK